MNQPIISGTISTLPTYAEMLVCCSRSGSLIFRVCLCSAQVLQSGWLAGSVPRSSRSWQGWVEPEQPAAALLARSGQQLTASTNPVIQRNITAAPPCSVSYLCVLHNISSKTHFVCVEEMQKKIVLTVFVWMKRWAGFVEMLPMPSSSTHSN